MYIKYTFASGAANSATSIKSMFDDVKAVFDGTYTSKTSFNSVCDQANSELIGGGSNITNDYTCTVNSNTTDNNDNTMVLVKNHSEYTASYPFKSSFYIYTTRTGTYGVRGWLRGNTGGSSFPSFLSSNYAHSNVNFKIDHQNTVPGSTYWFWANPYNCGFAFSSYNGSEYYMAGSFDHDITEYNKYVYDNDDTQHPAAIYVAGVLQASTYYTSSYTQYNNMMVGTTDYLGPDISTARGTTGMSGTNALYGGNSTSYTSDYMSLCPTPYKNIYPLQYSTGTQHQIIPVFVDPHYNQDTQSYPVNGRLKYFYRTSDNFGPTGTLITSNGQQYFAVNIHKTGAGLYNDATAIQNAVYLIPTSIGGY